MLFYLYVSQTKIEMLFNQLGVSEAKTTQVHSSISLPKIASLERTTTETKNASLFQKLDKVLGVLVKNDQLIALRRLLENDSLQRFVIDSGLWKALLIGKDYLIADNPKLLEDEKNRPWPNSYAVFCSRPEILVFLVGSPTNVLGVSAAKEIPYAVVSPSYTMDEYIMSLTEGNDERPEQILPGIAELFAYLWRVPEKMLKVCFVVYNRFETTDSLWREIVKNFELHGQLPPPRPKLIVLGSPLFVALA